MVFEQGLICVYDFLGFFISLLSAFVDFLFNLSLGSVGSLGSSLVALGVLTLLISFFILPFRIQRGSDGGGD